MKIKAIGATLLLSGTMLGAGMLALPLISAGIGFTNSIILLTAVYIFMTYTGLQTLEVCLNYPEGLGFADIAARRFGRVGRLVMNFSLLLLLYSLSCAYISGGSAIYTNILTSLGMVIPKKFIAIIFTAIIASIVYLSTRAVDVTNRFLFSTNIGVFFFLVFTLSPSIAKENLICAQDSFKYSFVAIPVFVTAFGFHGSIPSMIKYIGRDNPRTLRNVFIAGGLIPLVVYVIWECCTLGVLPRFGDNSFAYVAHHGGNLDSLLSQLQVVVNNNLVLNLIVAFSAIAMFTSYLCVSLGLFDTVAATFKRADNKKGRLFTAICTYLPPLIITSFYPNVFVPALGAAAIFLMVLAVLFPAGMLLKLRKSSHQLNYKVMGNEPVIKATLGLGFGVMLGQVLVLIDLLPTFG